MVEIRLFGGVRVARDRAPAAPVDGRPARALLCWLALHRGPQPRTLVAARLWPGVLEESARVSLRAALSALRRSVGPDAVVADRETVELAAGVDVDVRRFDDLLADGRRAEALALAGGELAPELDEGWAADARERYRERVARALGALAAEAEAAGDLAAAAGHARRRAGLDPLAEPAARELVRLLWTAGDRAGALAAYDRLRDRLRESRGVAPSPETRALVERLRRQPEEQAPSPRPPLPALVERLSRDPLAGRAAELAACRAAFAAARADGPRLLLLAGEPGIGKTRLAAELARTAHAGGATVLAGRANEDALVPFAAFAEALDGLGDLFAAPGGEGDADGARYRLFESVAAALGRLARQRPVLLLLDDLHWADEPSLRLLRHLLRAPRQLPLLLAGTYRESELSRTHPLARTLGELRREAQVERVRLAGLDREALGVLVEATLGRADPAVVDDLEERSGGNAFFARELLRDLVESGGAGLPEGVREVIGARASRLSGAANELLAVASVLGPSFEESLLGELLGRDPLTPLEEALHAGLLREEGGLRVAFAHALVREALYAELSTIRRVRLHEAAARALERRPSADLAEIARHRFEAAPDDPEAAIAAAEEAAAEALRTLAYEVAAGQYERGLQALPTGDEPQRARLLVKLGQALQRAGEHPRALGSFGEAAAIAERLGDGSTLAEAALGRAGVGVVIWGVDSDLVRLLERALDLLPGDEPRLRARVLARLAIALYYAPDAGRRVELAETAAAAARKLGDERVLAEVLNAERVALWSPEALERRLETSSELIAVARRCGDREAELQGRNWRIVDLLEVSDGSALREELDEYGRLADETRLPQHRWYAVFWQGLRETLRGDHERGAALRREAQLIGERAGDVNVGFAVRMHEAYEHLAVDGFGAWGAPELEVLQNGMARPHVAHAYRSCYAWFLADRGQQDEARAQLALVGSPSAAPRDANWLSMLFELSHAVCVLGERELGAEIASLLAPFAGHQMLGARAVMVFGAVDGCLGMLAALAGDTAAAVRHYEAAIAANERVGAPALNEDLRRRLAALGQPQGVPEKESGRPGIQWPSGA